MSDATKQFKRVGSVSSPLDEELGHDRHTQALYLTGREERMESIQHSTKGAALHAQTDGTCGGSIGFLLGVASVFTDASCVFGRSVGRLAALVVTFRSSARPIAVKRERRSTPKAFVWQQPAQGPNRCIGQPWLRLRIDNEI